MGGCVLGCCSVGGSNLATVQNSLAISVLSRVGQTAGGSHLSPRLVPSVGESKP